MRRHALLKEKPAGRRVGYRNRQKRATRENPLAPLEKTAKARPARREKIAYSSDDASGVAASRPPLLSRTRCVSKLWSRTVYFRYGFGTVKTRLSLHRRRFRQGVPLRRSTLEPVSFSTVVSPYVLAGFATVGGSSPATVEQRKASRFAVPGSYQVRTRFVLGSW